MYVRVHNWGSMLWRACEGQIATLWSWFSPSTFMQALRIELRLQGLHRKCPYPLSHLASLTQFFTEVGNQDTECLGGDWTELNP